MAPQRRQRPVLRAAPSRLRAGVTAGIAAAVAAILSGSIDAAHAADQPPEPAAAPAASTAPPVGESLEEVVVTANAQQGVKKLDASYNIVAADLEQIKEANPKSVADLLKVSPGIWPEASGGQTGANIEVAGFPSGGDSPFFTNMIEGLPMYGMPNLSFMDSSSLFRLDNTIERLEVVQGGTGALFGPGQMGATANFILRHGSATPKGEFSATYGSEGLWRGDAFYGFPIADSWYGSIGGFYRKSNGVRNSQFPADEGGQVTGTIFHDLENGSLMIWGRVLDDKNQFITPVPLIESANGTFSAYPGFDPLTGTYNSTAIQNVNVPNSLGGFESANLANGRGTNFFYFGVKWDQKLAGWQLSNNFMIDGGGLDTNALFSGNSPRPLSYFVYGCNVPEPVGYCVNGSPADLNNLDATGHLSTSGPTQGQGLSAATNVNATYATTGAAVPLSQSVVSQGWWYIQKSLQNIVDELRASREIFAGNTVTGGLYLTRYSDNDNWSLGNQMLMTNTPNATAINLSYVQGGHIYHITSPQGFVSFNGNFNILEHGDATNIAAYLSDSWKMGPWLIDAGARLEHIDAHQRTCNNPAQQLGTAYDLYEDATPECNGTFDYEHYVRTRPTFTAGANYELNDHTSAYVRINNGVHFDDFDNGIRQAKINNNGVFAPLQTVQNYEAGFKFQSSWAYLDISGYQRNFTGLTYTPTTISGVVTGPQSTYGSSTHGVDLDGSLSPFRGIKGLEGFNILARTSWEVGHYTDITNCVVYTSLLGQTLCANIAGAPLQRQPDWHALVTPNYTTPVPWGTLNLWLTYEYVGQRFEDQSGLQPLGTYYMLGAGIVTDIGDHWELRLQGTNLTNQIGLTEGNARVLGSSVGLGGVVLARPFEGREINITAMYKL